MEGVKHVWRNAACLLYVTGPLRYLQHGAMVLKQLLDSGRSGKQCPPTKFSELKPDTTNSQDVEIMFVKRHSKAGFMANAHVFPGGLIDKADYSPDWLNVFSHLSSSFTMFNSSLPLYSQIPSTNSAIAGEVAFRICAIREMFEEAGVLLARSKSDAAPLSGFVPGTISPVVKQLSPVTREHWRKRVHDDAYQFLALCHELDCVPDVWSLVEWSNWLTPRNSKRRYDTVFYMVFSESRPPLIPDGAEVTDSAWMSPTVGLEKMRAGELFLAPPQMAELMKLQSFPSTPCLHSFAIHNSVFSGAIERILSSRILTKDNIIMSLRDGDDLFPLGDGEDWHSPVQQPQAPYLRDKVELVLSDHPFYEYTIPDHTADELQELTKKYSRLVAIGLTDLQSLDNTPNIELVLEHIRNYQRTYSSKL